jgi:hypothetical protein
MPSTVPGEEGKVYTLVVTPNAGFAGLVTVNVPAGRASDAAGNPSTAATPSVQAVDVKAPTATIALGDSALKVGDTATVTITFSEAVEGFELGDLTAGNGTLTNLEQDAENPLVWTATFTPTANIEDTSNVVSLATTYTDAASNAGTAAASDNYTVDTLAPTVTITRTNGSGDSLIFTFDFSEAVYGLSITDITVNGAAPQGDLSGADGGTQYTLEVMPTEAEGSVTVSVPAGAATDAAGNDNTQASHSSSSYRVLSNADVSPCPTDAPPLTLDYTALALSNEGQDTTQAPSTPNLRDVLDLSNTEALNLDGFASEDCATPTSGVELAADSAEAAVAEPAADVLAGSPDGMLVVDNPYERLNEYCGWA